MSTPIFPVLTSGRLLGWRGITWGVTKKPIFKTQSQVALSGREAVQQNWSRPKYEITLKWSLLKNDRKATSSATMPTYPKDEFRRLHGFFEARRGSFEPFFLSCGSLDGDNYTVNELLVASTPAVAADPTNPDSRNYQMVRTFGGVTYPVGGIDTTTSAPIVYDDGTQVIGVQFNTPKDGWIRLPAAPSTGSELRATFHYYYRVAFKRDEAEFETFADDFWRLKTISLVTRWW